MFQLTTNFISKNWIKLIARILFLFSVGIDDYQFLDNLVLFKELSVVNSMTNAKVAILIITVGVTRRCLKNLTKSWTLSKDNNFNIY